MNLFYMLLFKSLARVCLFTLTLVVVSGCRIPDRISHFNNPENAASIDSDTLAFRSFTGTNGGLQSKIQGNNTAQLMLMQQVDDAHEKLRETSFVKNRGDKSWLSLKAEMWKAFGLAANIDINTFEQAKTASDLIQFEPDVASMDVLVTNQIAARMRKIQAIGKVLQALAEGQAALAKQAAKQASNNFVSLTNLLQKAQQLSSGTNTPPPIVAGETSTNNYSIANMLLLLQSEVIAAGKQWSQNDSIKTNATSLQKLILQQAENSRDPASAYALVAIIGTGLGSNDMASLDNFLTNLQAKIVSDLPTNKVDRVVAAVPHNPSGDSMDAIKQELVSMLTQPLNATTSNSSPPPVANPQSSPTYYEDAFNNSWSSAYQLVLSLTNHLTSSPGSLFKKSSIAKLSPSTINANASQNNSLLAIAGAIPAAAESISSAAQSLQFSLGGFQNILQDTNAIRQFTSLFSSGSSNYSQVLPLLLNTSSLDPRVGAFLNQSILQNTNLVNQWVKIGKDIQSQSLAAGARVMQYFYDLSKTQTSLYEENARHYTVLGGIGTKEIQRWDWIGDVYQRIKYIYQVNWTNQITGDVTDANYLFMDSPAISLFQDYYVNNATNLQPSAVNRGYTNVWNGVRILPAVLPTDRIIPSIRILSENAYEHQTASPSRYDPIGLYAQISVYRLKQAIELVLSSDFLINYNKEQASVLDRLLLGEIKDHSSIVDSIVLATYEADIRLQLGDSQAFHDTGITDADLQLVFQTLQAGFVGWIATKQ
jgi:hypothetical protein